jgi:hypothetical protein
LAPSGHPSRFHQIGAAITVVVSLGLFLSARRTSLARAIALACAVMIVGYILVRAVSLHQLDALFAEDHVRADWSRIPEFAGSVIILLSSLSRRLTAMPIKRP